MRHFYKMTKFNKVIYDKVWSSGSVLLRFVLLNGDIIYMFYKNYFI